MEAAQPARLEKNHMMKDRCYTELQTHWQYMLRERHAARLMLFPLGSLGTVSCVRLRGPRSRFASRGWGVYQDTYLLLIGVLPPGKKSDTELFWVYP